MDNRDIETALETLPDQVAAAQKKYQVAMLVAESTYSKEYLETKVKSVGEKLTVKDIDAIVISSDAYFKAKLHAIECESEYTMLRDRLYAAKKIAEMRTAF